LLVFVEWEKATKVLTTAHFRAFYSFTAFTWNLCKTFPETGSQKQNPEVAYLENTLKIITVTILGALLRKLATYFSVWHSLLISWMFKISKLCSLQEADLYQSLSASLSEARPLKGLQQFQHICAYDFNTKISLF